MWCCIPCQAGRYARSQELTGSSVLGWPVDERERIVKDPRQITLEEDKRLVANVQLGLNNENYDRGVLMVDTQHPCSGFSEHTVAHLRNLWREVMGVPSPLDERVWGSSRHTHASVGKPVDHQQESWIGEQNFSLFPVTRPLLKLTQAMPHPLKLQVFCRRATSTASHTYWT